MGEEYRGSGEGDAIEAPAAQAPGMRIDVLTVLPTMFVGPLDHSIIGRARTRKLLNLRMHDLRDWTHDRHRTTDDYAFGGGGGMVMKPEPWGAALSEVAQGATIVFTTLLFVHKRGPTAAALQRRGFSMGMAPGRGGVMVGTQFKF